MPLINTKCSNCGGSIQMDASMESGLCTYCGNKYRVEDEIQKINIKVEVYGKVQLGKDDEVANLVARARAIYELLQSEIQPATVPEDLDHIIDKNSIDTSPLYKRFLTYIYRIQDIQHDNADALNLLNEYNQLKRQLDENKVFLIAKERRDSRRAIIFLVCLVLLMLVVYIVLDAVYSS